MIRLAWQFYVILALALSSALAQDNYPSRPVRLVVAFPPGAQTDVAARLLAQKLGQQLNANFFVDNKPGAKGNIGAEFVARSSPDGSTILINTASLVIPTEGEKLAYDVFKDLTPVSLIASTPFLLALNTSVSANTVPEFIAYLKANPGKLAYGSGGIGSTNHLGMLLFLQATGATAIHVPYKGGSQAMADLVAGRLQFGMHNVGSVRKLSLKPLAITSGKRSAELPDVPTIAESVPGFEYGNWYGMLAPARTPSIIVNRLSNETAKALRDPQVISKLGANPIGSTPAEYGAYLKSEYSRFAKVTLGANLKN